MKKYSLLVSLFCLIGCGPLSSVPLEGGTLPDGGVEDGQIASDPTVQQTAVKPPVKPPVKPVVKPPVQNSKQKVLDCLQKAIHGVEGYIKAAKAKNSGLAKNHMIAYCSACEEFSKLPPVPPSGLKITPKDYRKMQKELEAFGLLRTLLESPNMPVDISPASIASMELSLQQLQYIRTSIH